MSFLYLPRVIDKELDELLKQLPAISIEGPKGVGKTESARRRVNTVYELDDPAQFEIVKADPTQICEGKRPILIDEWQRIPEVWDVLRRAVDRNSDPNQFLLTGSASPSNKRPTHSGAGRIVTLRLRPMSLMERNIDKTTVSLKKIMGGCSTIKGRSALKPKDYIKEIISSGFPGLRRYNGRALREQLNSYIERIVDTDFEQMGRKIRKPQTLKRWLTAYAAASSTTASYETIRDAATAGQNEKPSKRIVQPYREILEKLWIIEEVPAWVPSRNQFSRLSSPPKHELADPALAAALLGIDEKALLKGDKSNAYMAQNSLLLGNLFEALVIQSVRVYAQASEVKVKHFRTMGGRHEVDFILERADQKIIAGEIKLGRTVEDKDVKNLLWLKNKMKKDLIDMIIINTGPQAYRRNDGVAVIPASLLMP